MSTIKNIAKSGAKDSKPSEETKEVQNKKQFKERGQKQNILSKNSSN